MVIVTQNQYLLASKIHHITMDENVNYVDVKTKNGRHMSLRDVHYSIQIIYSPETVTSQNNGTLRNSEEHRECCVTIRTAVNAHKVFKDLIQQIREQMPDQLYLDTALERMIANMDMTALEERDLSDKKDECVLTVPMEKKRANRKPKKIRKSGKAKRGSKTLLRKSK